MYEKGFDPIVMCLFEERSTVYIRPGNRATLGLLRAYFSYCRTVGPVPVIPYPPKNSSSTIYYNYRNRYAKGPKIPICTAY